MLQTEPSTRRIARNTMMLYLRTLLSVVVGLYTSRVVLHTLGVEDYGIYGLVGGIVSMLGFLNASLAGATSRFITYDLGAGNFENLKQTFNTAFQSHLLIAFIIVLISETIGLWFVNYQLDIPQERHFAANCIYQISILSAVFGITQAPYAAVVLAHEQMDVYAWLEILNAILKLIIVWILQLTSNDRLIFYGILVFAVTVLIRTLYRIFCHRHYPESHLFMVWNPVILRKMLSFTGWNLYADASVSVRQQGINILINRFFGVALNASCGLASMIQGIFWTLGYNVVAAFRPQIIKQYASGNFIRMMHLMGQALKITLVLLCLFSIPVIIEMPFLLQLWLNDVPAYTVVFCRILLLDNLLGIVNFIINLGVYAQGDIKRMSVASGTYKFLCLPVIFLLFHFAFTPAWAYWCNLICLVVIVATDFYFLKVQVPQIDVKYIFEVFVKSFSLMLLATIGYIYLHSIFPDTLYFKFICFLLFVLILILLAYFFLLDKAEKRSLILLIHSRK